MDEALQELVSRYIDGDLDDVETAHLENRADTDAALAAEIDAARRLREAVAGLADQIEPPATLDRVMEPLRQSSPAPARSVRPVYRWLGAAAAAVIGVTVAVEVARRNPEPSLTRPNPVHQRPASDSDEIFELAPLPTARPDDNHPLGAADHLLQEDPQPPAAPEPDPLEVMGPLPIEAQKTIVSEANPSGRPAASKAEDLVETENRPSAPVAREQVVDATGASSGALAQAPPKGARLATADDRSATARPSGKSVDSLGAFAEGKTEPVDGVILRIDGTDYRTGRWVRCPTGRRKVRVEVRANTVVEMVLLADENDTEAGAICSLDNLIGSTISGLGDGRYLGEIVIEPPSP